MYQDPRIFLKVTHGYHTLQSTTEKTQEKKQNNHPTKRRSLYKHLEIQSSQSQVPRHQYKSKTNKNQDNMFPLEPSNSTTESPKYAKIIEA